MQIFKTFTVNVPDRYPMKVTSLLQCSWLFPRCCIGFVRTVEPTQEQHDEQ